MSKTVQKTLDDIYKCIMGEETPINGNKLQTIKNELKQFERPGSISSFVMLDNYGEELTEKKTMASGVPPPPPPPPPPSMPTLPSATKSSMPTLPSATNTPSNRMALLGALQGFNKSGLNKVELPGKVKAELEERTNRVEKSMAQRTEVVNNIGNPNAANIAQQAMNVKLKPREQKQVNETSQQKELSPFEQLMLRRKAKAESTESPESTA
jgi:hypothetical protein